MDTMVLLILILLANGAPVIMSYLFSHQISLPIDLGYKLKDQQRLFGETKTWRGLIASIIATSIAASLFSFTLYIGFMIAISAMAGDLFSSFIKRRLKKASSSPFFLLDQIPESLFPALILMFNNLLDLIQVIEIVVAFIIMEIALSFALHRFGIRKHPY